MTTKKFESFEANGSKVTVMLPSADSTDWITVKQEIYRPDKDQFVYDRFVASYPNIKLDDSKSLTENVKVIYALCSRSEVLNYWLSKVNVEYSLDAGTPTFYKNLVEPTVFMNATKTLTKINDISSAEALELQAAAFEYKEKIKRISANFNKERKNKIGNDKLLRILTIKSTQLPLSLQMAIENYTPAQDAPTQRAYAREILIQFKVSLIEEMNKNPDFDIDKYLEAISVK